MPACLLAKLSELGGSGCKGIKVNDNRRQGAVWLGFRFLLCVFTIVACKVDRARTFAALIPCSPTSDLRPSVLSNLREQMPANCRKQSRIVCGATR